MGKEEATEQPGDSWEGVNVVRVHRGDIGEIRGQKSGTRQQEE